MKPPELTHQPDEVMEPAGFLWSPDPEGERWYWTLRLGGRGYPTGSRFMAIYREKDWTERPR